MTILSNAGRLRSWAAVKTVGSEAKKTALPTKRAENTQPYCANIHSRLDSNQPWYSHICVWSILNLDHMTSMLTPELFAEGAKALAAASINAELTEPWVWVEHPGPLSTAMVGHKHDNRQSAKHTVLHVQPTHDFSAGGRLPLMHHHNTVNHAQ
jgi:hypothetical protein